MFKNGSKPVIFLGIFLMSAGVVLGQQSFDINLVNSNFKNMLGLRLNNFPRPQFVKQTAAAFNGNRLGFEVKFITAEDFNAKFEGKGVVANPFVDNKIIYVVMTGEAQRKAFASIDRSHADYEKMRSAIDLVLILNELIFEMTSPAQRTDILMQLTRISKSTEDGTEKTPAILATIRKHLSSYQVVKFFLEAKSRYGQVRPDGSILDTLLFISGHNVNEAITVFLEESLFGK
ncbi:MAG: hypothetical protein A2831_01580 [Candidatus Yanofskybacteria bacterium RIFCSPHIGHO2_01_FULL_44_17]|uniref:Uncharacterized protein n=1 Tax=Candidatus Yanofskybacteria bacterium RIFCSPHIGHO2_01_FULL_44_17 TaxID=1802668 RepID=A0A1F8EZE3_9BACT|nr:MAG: hypothetical protein A2831_01580 [Candidatus Yanofskybacteria bacterium RIFCSPHIGHO2_01_FULL_44_17]